jgi:two-component system, NtrC family, response regulator
MSAAHADTSGRTRGRVLIVDDQDGMRELLKMILEADYHVAEADSGAALHQALEQEPPDVVLLDVKLADANGLGLVPTIKQRWPETEVIVMSGTPRDADGGSWAEEAVKSGAFGFLSKSADFNLEHFLAGVSSALERRYEGRGANLSPRAEA